jgi:hypothetical protein
LAIKSHDLLVEMAGGCQELVELGVYYPSPL